MYIYTSNRLGVNGGFQFMRVPPNHPVVMDDHDLVLKPTVIWGSPWIALDRCVHRQDDHGPGSGY